MKIQARLSFPALFTAEKFQDSPAKFSATLLVPKDSPEAATLWAEVDRVARAKWGARADKILQAIRPVPNRCCVQDGDLKDYDGYAGQWALRASSNVRPLVVDKNRNPLVEADGKPYSGCYVIAIFDLYAYETGGNGVGANLSGIQFARDGDAFGGGRVARVDDFDVLEGADADALS